MPTSNPHIAEQLKQARDELARLKAEKLRLYPPNPRPLAQADRFPRGYTDREIRHRNELVERIERLEGLIEELEERLYQK